MFGGMTIEARKAANKVADAQIQSAQVLLFLTTQYAALKMSAGFCRISDDAEHCALLIDYHKILIGEYLAREVEELRDFPDGDKDDRQPIQLSIRSTGCSTG